MVYLKIDEPTLSHKVMLKDCIVGCVKRNIQLISHNWVGATISNYFGGFAAVKANYGY